MSGGVCDGGGHADLRRMGRLLLYRHFSVETLVRVTGWMRVIGVDGWMGANGHDCQLRWQTRRKWGAPSRGFRALRVSGLSGPLGARRVPRAWVPRRDQGLSRGPDLGLSPAADSPLTLLPHVQHAHQDGPRQKKIIFQACA